MSTPYQLYLELTQVKEARNKFERVLEATLKRGDRDAATRLMRQYRTGYANEDPLATSLWTAGHNADAPSTLQGAVIAGKINRDPQRYAAHQQLLSEFDQVADGSRASLSDGSVRHLRDPELRFGFASGSQPVSAGASMGITGSGARNLDERFANLKSDVVFRYARDDARRKNRDASIAGILKNNAALGSKHRLQPLQYTNLHGFNARDAYMSSSPVLRRQQHPVGVAPAGRPRAEVEQYIADRQAHAAMMRQAELDQAHATGMAYFG
jgi:hypothetical protein